jgi:hypothetical protein
VLAIIFLAQPLLLIFGGIVFASIIDGGTRLLGRVLPIGRGWRLLIVSLAAVAFWSAPSGSPASSSPPRRSTFATSSPCRSTSWWNWPPPTASASIRSRPSR